MTTISIETVGAHHAAHIAGITYRQLDYWARTGLIEPAVPAVGSGSRRRYSRANIRALQAVRVMLDAGFHLFRVRGILAAVDMDIDDDTVGLIISSNRSTVARSRDEMTGALSAGYCVLPLPAASELDDEPADEDPADRAAARSRHL